MIDRKIGDKPIYFEMSLGNPQLLLSVVMCTRWQMFGDVFSQFLIRFVM